MHLKLSLRLFLHVECMRYTWFILFLAIWFIIIELFNQTKLIVIFENLLMATRNNHRIKTLFSSIPNKKTRIQDWAFVLPFWRFAARCCGNSFASSFSLISFLWNILMSRLFYLLANLCAQIFAHREELVLIDRNWLQPDFFWQWDGFNACKCRENGTWCSLIWWQI